MAMRDDKWRWGGVEGPWGGVEDLKCDGEQWRSVQCEEEALKGKRKAFNCKEEALN